MKLPVTLIILFILSGLYFIGDAAYDEHRKVASAAQPYGYFRGHTYLQSEDPKAYRDLMNYQWMRGPLFLCAGLLLLSIWRRQEQCDPLSSSFAGNSALDTLSDELDRQKRIRR